jgi:hypothetical protein
LPLIRRRHAADYFTPPQPLFRYFVFLSSLCHTCFSLTAILPFDALIFTDYYFATRMPPGATPPCFHYQMPLPRDASAAAAAAAAAADAVRALPIRALLTRRTRRFAAMRYARCAARNAVELVRRCDGARRASRSKDTAPPTSATAPSAERLRDAIIVTPFSLFDDVIIFD